MYDARDKLVEVQQGSSILSRFQYDFEGRRIKKIGEEGLRQYVYDQTSLLAEYDAAGLQKAKYDYGSDRLISLTRTDEGRRYFSLDGLRSVVNLTDDSGSTVASYHLDAWGSFRFPSELTASRNRFAFTGHVFDSETGLYNAKARYFDPKLGRFLTQDSFLGQIDEPPSLHRYVYANDRPTFYVDPTGHAAEGANQEVDEGAILLARAKRQDSQMSPELSAALDSYANRNMPQVVAEKRSEASGVRTWLSEKWASYQEKAEQLKKRLGSAASGAWHSLFGGERSADAEARRNFRGDQTAAFDDENSKQVLHHAEVTGKGIENATADLAREGAERTFEAGKTYAETEIGAGGLGMAIGGAKLGGKALGREIDALKAEERAVAQESKSLRRPYVRRGVRTDVEVSTPRTATGEPIDPNTLQPIEGKPDLGHRYGREFRREKAKAEAEALSQKEFNERMNDPDLYQLEDPSANRSHRYEKPGKD